MSAAPPPVAVVTGSASGIGARVVQRLLDRGLHVIGIDLSRGDAVDDERLATVVGSVAETQTWSDATELAKHEFGADPTVAVFCAAVLIPGSITDLSEQDWARHLEVNVTSIFRGIRALLPAMRARGEGSIVTVSSIDASLVERDLVGYCASKGALLQLTRSVAIDTAREGIRCNTVAPGVVDTPFFRRHVDASARGEELLEYRRSRNPIGRFLEPDEVARTIEFVALDATGMTGSLIPIDGGLPASFDFRDY